MLLPKPRALLERCNVRFERSVIGSWLDVASRARITIRRGVGGEVLHLLEQGLERIRVWHLLHHVIEQVLDVGVNALRREDGLDDFLCRLLAMVDRVAILAACRSLAASKSAWASRSVLAMTRSALIQRHTS
jgi:hypothetical protein